MLPELYFPELSVVMVSSEELALALPIICMVAPERVAPEVSLIVPATTPEPFPRKSFPLAVSAEAT